MRRSALLFVTVALAAAGCGGGGGGDQKTAEVTAVSASDLAIMVLPASVIGPAADGLDVDPDSGPTTTTEDLAESTLDPDDTAEDYAESGFVSGYELDYSTGALDKTLVSISSQVTVFETAEQAVAFVDEVVGDAASLEGKEVAPGVELTSVEVEQADGPGDNAWRGTATIQFGENSFTSSVHAFTVGVAAAQVSVVHATGKEPPADLEELAAALEERIIAVATGEVTDEPVPIPDEDGDEETTTTAAEDAVLEQMVLQLEDLPDGVSIEKDGYVKDGGDVSFEREFDLGTTRIGESELVGLQSNVEQMDSATEASLVVGLVGDIIEGPEGAKLFAQAAGAEGGFDPKSVEITRIPAEGIGDKSTLLHGTFDVSGITFEAVFAFIAVGRAAGQIYAMGGEGNVQTDDVVELARTMAKRMETGR